MKISQLLKQTSIELSKVSDSASLDARVLLCHAMDKDFTYLIAHGNDEVPENILSAFSEMISKRKAHMPVSYITNRREFMSMDFYVDERVLIPRADTEILVEKAVELIGENEFSVLDMCCGSGCIGLSVKKYCKNIFLTLADISEGALSVTKINADKHFPGNNSINFVQTDLFGNIEGRFDFILTNPPYISFEEMKTLQKDILEYEPRNALEAENDGLFFYEKIISQADDYLNSGGYVICEIGCSQADAVVKLFKDNGYADTEVLKDYAGLDRVVLGKKK